MRARDGRSRRSLTLKSSLSLTVLVSLERFRAAQSDGTYERALGELRAGDKRGHWMWFVFPQLAGLGTSSTALRYAISSVAEARAYLADPVLGHRLRECATALLSLAPAASAERVLGPVDALKLRSSATLFARAGDDTGVFTALLERFYGGQADPLTVRLLTPGDPVER